jgi:Beta-lactamase
MEREVRRVDSSHSLNSKGTRSGTVTSARSHVEYDIPDHFLPEFAPAVYFNQRSDLSDVSQGKLITFEIIATSCGLDALGLVVESITEQPLGHYMQENLWKALGMLDTSFVARPAAASARPTSAAGLRARNARIGGTHGRADTVGGSVWRLSRAAASREDPSPAGTNRAGANAKIGPPLG